MRDRSPRSIVDRGSTTDFTVTLSLLPEAGPQVIPAVLERTSGELVIQLQRPDGQLRILHPRQLSCTAARRRLRPRQKIRRHDSLISDCSDLVFPIPGRYRVRALVPKTGSRSAWVAIDVEPASGALAEPAMLEFLRRGMPGGADAHWRQLDGVIADTALAQRLAPTSRAERPDADAVHSTHCGSFVPWPLLPSLSKMPFAALHTFVGTVQTPHHCIRR